MVGCHELTKGLRLVLQLVDVDIRGTNGSIFEDLCGQTLDMFFVVH